MVPYFGVLLFDERGSHLLASKPCDVRNHVCLAHSSVPVPLTAPGTVRSTEQVLRVYLPDE